MDKIKTLEEKYVKAVTTDIVADFKTLLYSKIFGDGSEQYLKIVN